MPILRLKEIRDMPTEDRTRRLDEFKTELTRLRTMIGAGGTVENPARIKHLRRAIAKILTTENEQKHRPTKSKARPAEEKEEKKKEKKRVKKEEKKKK